MKDNILVFPSIQFVQDEESEKWSMVQGLDQVLQQFQGIQDESMMWVLASWINAPSADLEGKSIISYLKEGYDPQLPIELAEERYSHWID